MTFKIYLHQQKVVNYSAIDEKLSVKIISMHAKLHQACLTLGDPMDCSLPGSSAHGIFQARVLEWGAIAFSE